MSAHDLDTILKLSCDDRSIHATLLVAPCENPSSVTAEMVIAYLEGQGIRRQLIDKEAVATICAEVASDPGSAHRCEVAKGTEPIDATQPQLILDDELAERLERAERQKLDAEKAETGSNSDSRIDFYEMSSIVIVQRGQRLAQIERKTEPEDGVDVFGQSIPAAETATFDGVDTESVVLRDDECFARFSGEIVVAGPQLRVNRDLEITGDIDFSIGRIDFPGDVCIHGSVQDKFSVKAGGDLEIRALVGSAQIESTGSITLTRGMAGKGTGHITAWRDLTSGYLESVHAFVARDLRVKGEITNCTLKVDGELDAGSASIRSGEIIIAKAATVGTIGSEQGIKTVLVLGSVPEIEALTRQADGLTSKLQTLIDERKKKFDAFNAAIGKPNASQIEERMAMEFAINELESRREVLNGAQGELIGLLGRHACCSLSVKRAIHAKTEIYLPGYRCSFDRDIVGECTITLDHKGIPVIEHRGETKPLREFAKVVTDDRILAISPGRTPKAA